MMYKNNSVRSSVNSSPPLIIGPESVSHHIPLGMLKLDVTYSQSVEA